jgi:hypothetical protein
MKVHNYWCSNTAVVSNWAIVIKLPDYFAEGGAFFHINADKLPVAPFDWSTVLTGRGTIEKKQASKGKHILCASLSQR